MHDRQDVSALWQRETRNLIEDCAAEADALAAVRQMVDVSGASALADVVLLAGPLDGDAPMRTVAVGPELVRISPRRRTARRMKRDSNQGSRGVTQRGWYRGWFVLSGYVSDRFHRPSLVATLPRYTTRRTPRADWCTVGATAASDAPAAAPTRRRPQRNQRRVKDSSIQCIALPRRAQSVAITPRCAATVASSAAIRAVYPLSDEASSIGSPRAAGRCAHADSAWRRGRA